MDQATLDAGAALAKAEDHFRTVSERYAQALAIKEAAAADAKQALEVMQAAWATLAVRREQAQHQLETGQALLAVA